MIDWDYLSSLDFSTVWTYRAQLLAGLETTVFLMTVSAGMGVAGGVSLAILSQSRLRPLRWFVVLYVEAWRNTPLLVQLFWIHFALPFITGVNTSPLQSGLIALSANVSAYFAEIFRAGIQAIDRGQWDAARALALPPGIVWLRVILPQAIRIVLPPLASMMISLFKATAILSVLSINDLMRVAASLSNYTFQPVELYTAAALMYFAVGALLSRAAAYVERRASQSERG